jgi:hypothetical protein
MDCWSQQSDEYNKKVKTYEKETTVEYNDFCKKLGEITEIQKFPSKERRKNKKNYKNARQTRRDLLPLHPKETPTTQHMQNTSSRSRRTRNTSTRSTVPHQRTRKTLKMMYLLSPTDQQTHGSANQPKPQKAHKIKKHTHAQQTYRNTKNDIPKPQLTRQHKQYA